MAELSIAGTFAGPTGKFNGIISFENGIITRVKESDMPGDADFIFPKDMLVFPGFVDPHVHLRWGQEYKEDFITGCQAAANGGVTYVLDMPNNPEAVTTREILERKARAAGQCSVGIGLYAIIGPGTKPIPGHTLYKAFMGHSVGNVFFEELETLDSTLAAYSGMRVAFHAEDPEIIRKDPARPPEAEIKAIGNAIELVRKHNLKGHICHLSTKKGLELVLDAQQQGLKITCEVTPHHLFFSKESNNNPLVKMNPPLRSEADRKFLLKQFRAGYIDMIGSDHAPHTELEKKESNPSGVPLLDTYGLVVAWLIKEHQVTPEVIAKCCSAHPAQFAGIELGNLAEGELANFTVLNFRPKTVTKHLLKTKCGWSPFEGMTFPGSVEATFVKGKRLR